MKQRLSACNVLTQRYTRLESRNRLARWSRWASGRGLSGGWPFKRPKWTRNGKTLAIWQKVFTYEFSACSPRIIREQLVLQSDSAVAESRVHESFIIRLRIYSKASMIRNELVFHNDFSGERVHFAKSRSIAALLNQKSFPHRKNSRLRVIKVRSRQLTWSGYPADVESVSVVDFEVLLDYSTF